MHIALLLALNVTATPTVQTLQFGKLTLVMRQTSEGRDLTRCSISTSVQGGKATHRRESAGVLAQDLNCFEVARYQDVNGFVLVRENMGKPHTLLIAATGEMVNVDSLTVPNRQWDAVAARSPVKQ